MLPRYFFPFEEHCTKNLLDSLFQIAAIEIQVSFILYTCKKGSATLLNNFFRRLIKHFAKTEMVITAIVITNQNVLVTITIGEKNIN